MIRVCFFAALRERVGQAELSVTPPETVTTVTLLADWLGTEQPPVAEAFAATPRWLVAVNEELSHGEAPVTDGDVVAFFPPVTGG